MLIHRVGNQFRCDLRDVMVFDPGGAVSTIVATPTIDSFDSVTLASTAIAPSGGGSIASIKDLQAESSA